MDKDQAYTVGKLLGSDQIKPPNAGGYVHICCPLAPWEHQNGTDSSPSFGIHVDPAGTSSMHCFSCNWSGDLIQLLLELKHHKAELDFKTLMGLANSELDGGGLPSLLTQEEQAHHGVSQYPESWLSSFPSVFDSGQAYAYLQTRKGGPVPEQVIIDWDLRWDAFRKRVCTPVRGWDHRLHGLHGRSIDPEQEMKYLAYTHPTLKGVNPEVWLGEHLVDWTKPVVFAESKFDLFRTYQCYRNVVSNLKAGLMDAALNRVKSAFEIVTLFDRDKAGDLARRRVTKWAEYAAKKGGAKRIVRHVYLPVGEDGGSMPAEELAEYLSTYVDLDPLIL